jgi:hypothetical protein
MKGHNSAGMNRKSVQAEPLLGHFPSPMSATGSALEPGSFLAHFPLNGVLALTLTLLLLPSALSIRPRRYRVAEIAQRSN